LVAVVLVAPSLSEAQGDQTSRPVDSIVVEGTRRMDYEQAVQASGFVTGRPFSYREVQRAVRSLYATGEYSDVQVFERTLDGRRMIVIKLRERPILVSWTLRGAARVSEGKLKGKSQLLEGRPFDPAALIRSVAFMDSIYRTEGYYLARVRPLRVYDADSSHVRVTFE